MSTPTKSAGNAGTSLYDDSWHRPHADHAKQIASVTIDDGPMGLHVSLDQWGPQGTALATLYNQAISNWGESPSYVQRDEELSLEQMKVVEAILDGKHLSNALEAISFSFTIDGCTRACTHELVRTRVGASFAQHGGRDNDWRHRHWTMPETIKRVLNQRPKEVMGSMLLQLEAMGLDVRHIDLDAFAGDILPNGSEAHRSLRILLIWQKAMYAAMVDAGVPWQDARRVLGIGHQTYIHANYNFLALKGVTAHRLEHGAVDWEIDCVAQLMQRELYLRCPRVLAKRIRSHSDAAGVNKFATLYSWPPNGKYPEPKDYDPSRKTQFNRGQMLFWILDPVCLIDEQYPVGWIQSNGTFPHEQYKRRLEFANSVAEKLGKEPL